MKTYSTKKVAVFSDTLTLIGGSVPPGDSLEQRCEGSVRGEEPVDVDLTLDVHGLSSQTALSQGRETGRGGCKVEGRPCALHRSKSNTGPQRRTT